MIKTYRKKERVEAEQYDGSQEMAKRYSIQSKMINDRIIDVLPTSLENRVIKKGDWIVELPNGIMWVYENKKFMKEYEED